MQGRPHLHFLRGAAAAIVVATYLLPLLWWAFSAFADRETLLSPSRILSGAFTLSLDSFAITMMGDGGTIFDSRDSLRDSLVVALFSSALTVAAALSMAQGLSMLRVGQQRFFMGWFLLQRAIPPVALVFPLVMAYHSAGLLDTWTGIILAHTGLNLPIAVLLLRSFLADIPPEVLDASTLDGATTCQQFTRIALPLLKSGIAATFILCFTLSWIEFIYSLFLTQNLRLVPVQSAILVMNMWGLVASFTVTALLPVFLFAFLMQKHLVRGLTLGMQR